MNVGQYLLRPSAHIQDTVERFYFEHMAGRHIVALHLRTIEYMTAREQRTALRCASFLAQGDAGSIFVASDTSAGMLTGLDFRVWM
jgi:hypothetical protein